MMSTGQDRPAPHPHRRRATAAGIVGAVAGACAVLLGILQGAAILYVAGLVVLVAGLGVVLWCSVRAGAVLRGALIAALAVVVAIVGVGVPLTLATRAEHRVWSASFDGSPSGMVATDTTLTIASGESGDGVRLASFDLRSGARHPVVEIAGGSGVRALSAGAGNLVVVTTSTTVNLVDTARGTVVWSGPVAGEATATQEIAAAEGVVVFAERGQGAQGGADRVAARGADGAVVWQSALTATTPAETRIPTEGADDVRAARLPSVVLGTHGVPGPGTAAVSLDALTGDELETRTGERPLGASGDTVFWQLSDPDAAEGSTCASAVSVAGEERWALDLPCVRQQPYALDQVLDTRLTYRPAGSVQNEGDPAADGPVVTVDLGTGTVADVPRRTAWPPSTVVSESFALLPTVADERVLEAVPFGDGDPSWSFRADAPGMYPNVIAAADDTVLIRSHSADRNPFAQHFSGGNDNVHVVVLDRDGRQVSSVRGLVQDMVPLPDGRAAVTTVDPGGSRTTVVLVGGS